MKVDIGNLEKLACLSLTNEQKEKVSQSIDGVVSMFDSILTQEVNLNQSNNNPNYQTKFRPENASLSFEITKGVNLVDDKYFLAPKVIKKD